MYQQDLLSGQKCKTAAGSIQEGEIENCQYDSDDNRASISVTSAHDVTLESTEATKTCKSSTTSTQSVPAQAIGTTSNGAISSGYYDAEKCRAHLANLAKVSKIDRFAAQVSRALEVEAEMQFRLGNLLNMFNKRSAQVAHDFTLRCRLGLQRHQQDRILNQKRRKSSSDGPKQSEANISKKKIRLSSKRSRSSLGATLPPISNDLLYGPGAQLIQKLLSENSSFNSMLHTDVRGGSRDLAMSFKVKTEDKNDPEVLTEYFVRHMREKLVSVVERGRAIGVQLNNVMQLFERLAMDHRDQVDAVYAAEEERLSRSGVVRRSTNQLTMAAIKATTTPVHIVSNNPTLS